MDNREKDQLAAMVLAPYIQKAYALIGVKRDTGGNQFRHCMATMSILIDYHYIDSALLKAAIIHDLFEDFEDTKIEEIRNIGDSDVEEVIRLVIELTKPAGEPKSHYYERLLVQGSTKAKILKCADQISNLTDLHVDTFSFEKTRNRIKLAERYILPMAAQVDPNMKLELEDMIETRKIYLKAFDKGIFNPILMRQKRELDNKRRK